MICPIHKTTMLTEHTSGKKFCKGKSRSLAQQQTYERKRDGKRAEAVQQ